MHEQTSKKTFELDGNLIRRIAKEMERIKPEARTRLFNCFEGELDSKKYYDYLMGLKVGGSPRRDYYYQWQNRQRDVSSVLLIDASESGNRLVNEDGKTVLDCEKEAAYYFAAGAESLEDKCAVIAYNGKGVMNSRIFILKSFQDGLTTLGRRLELLGAELNNRDGSAIRYATNYLIRYPTKTRFLIHLSDMQPSDLEFEEFGRAAEEAIRTYNYEGETAVEDVIHALSSARTNNIIPIGFCLRKKPEEKKDGIKKTGKINPTVLAKLKRQMAQSSLGNIDERLKRAFQRNFLAVEDITKLPEILRESYLRISFEL